MLHKLELLACVAVAWVGFGWPVLLGLLCRDRTLGLRSGVPLVLIAILDSGGAKLESLLPTQSNVSNGNVQVLLAHASRLRPSSLRLPKSNSENILLQPTGGLCEKPDNS